MNARAARCLAANFEGNAALDRGNLTGAIACYDAALATGHAPQRGVLLVMRATAQLQRAYMHCEQVRAAHAELASEAPNDGVRVLATESNTLAIVAALDAPALFTPLLRSLAARAPDDAPRFAAARFHYALYEVALAAAADDACAACALLPTYAKCWLRAGEALALLGALESALIHYEEAALLEPAARPALAPTLERLTLARQILAAARAQGYPDADVLDLLAEI